MMKVPRTFYLTLSLSALALMLACLFPSPDRIVACCAMLLSTLGDIVLMNLKGYFQGLPFPYFYLGASLFILAHLVYSAAYLIKITSLGYTLINAGFIAALILILAVFLAVTLLALRRKPFDLPLYLVCTLYLLIIGASCAIICSFAYASASLASLAAIGALSFFLSDLIIGLDRLAHIAPKNPDRYIWTLYPIGQLLILLCA